MTPDEMFGKQADKKNPDETPEEAPAKTEAAAKRAETILWVRGQISQAVQIAGTPGERYLVEHRHLKGPWPRSILWADRYQPCPGALQKPCLLAVVTNPGGEIIATQASEIDTVTGGKSRRTDKPKKSRGPVGEGTVYLGNQDETPAVLAIGEGLETALTRLQIGPCDAHACLGQLRFVEPKNHHTRVEILADTDKRESARKLARSYAARFAKRGLQAFVVTVPDMLGAKADLNDALRDLGLPAVQMAVEDAEPIIPTTGNRVADLDLEIGSDIELAHHILDKLQELYGPIVFADGRFWRFDRTHYVSLDDNLLARFVHLADGAWFPTADGKRGVVKLNRTRVGSILDAALKYLHQADFFAYPPLGINCESGFIAIDGNGNARCEPHARRWRQRHLVRGRWPAPQSAAAAENSLLAKYLAESTMPRADDDEEKEKGGAADHADEPQDCADRHADTRDKQDLLGEIAGCVALGQGTRLRQPKAVIAHSDQALTGKSAFLKLLRSFPNPEAVASVPPSKFGDDKWTHQLIGKTLNASDELSERALRSEMFKRIVTGEETPARDVYKSATSFRPIAQHVYSTNELPSFSGGVDNGVLRRVLPVEFANKIAEVDPDLVEKILRDEADLLLDFAVTGACRLIRQRDFTIPSSSRDALQQWSKEADPVRGWADRLQTTHDEVVQEQNAPLVKTFYEDFTSWAETEQRIDRKYLPSLKTFGKRLRAARPDLNFKHSRDGTKCLNARLKRGRA